MTFLTFICVFFVCFNFFYTAMTVWVHRYLMNIFMLHTVPSSSSSYISFTKLSWIVFDRFPQLRFDYTDPEKNFDRRRVHGLVCKLVQVKDTANATALEVTAGGKVSLRILEVCSLMRMTLTSLIKTRAKDLQQLIFPVTSPFNCNFSDGFQSKLQCGFYAGFIVSL